MEQVLFCVHLRFPELTDRELSGQRVDRRGIQELKAMGAIQGSPDQVGLRGGTVNIVDPSTAFLFLTLL
jgi:hypothetical protein